MITLTEILGRAAQGRTEPFICRGDDGLTYYVKGRHAGLRSLCCEWVAGSLARRLLLPVPDFTMAEVPQELLTGSDRADIRELGPGPVFASAKVEDARELNWEDAVKLEPYDQARVLLFDLWTQNEDRSLSALGGNPNLLVTHEPVMIEGEETDHLERQLWMIDFNLAFDPDFDAPRFWSGHVFTQLMRQWPRGFQDMMSRDMEQALRHLPAIFDQLPQEWLYIDGDDTLPVQLDQTTVYNTLSGALAAPDVFWTLP